MWDRVQGAVSNVRALFGKAGERRSKCPRCKGSGLLACSTNWWRNLAPSNEPCWFCEGVGAMPIVGLNGFFLARATPIIQACDHHLKPSLPLKSALYLGKFPETRCKFTTFKPDEELFDLLHDFGSIPSWMISTGEWDSRQDGSRGSHFKSPVQYQESFKTIVRSPVHFVSRQKFQSSSKSSENLKRNGRKFSRPCKSPNTKSTSASTNNPSYDPKNPYLRSNHIRLPSTTKIKSEADFLAEDKPRRGGYSGSALYILTSTGSLSNGSVSSGQAQTETFQNFESVKQTNVLNGSRPRSPLVSSPRSPRSPRKERNRIREKAGKEAVERARQIMRPLTSRKDQATSFAQYGQSEDLQSFINRHWTEASGSWHEPWTGRGQSIPSTVTSKASSIRSLALSGQSWINQLVYGGVQGALHFPKPGKS